MGLQEPHSELSKRRDRESSGAKPLMVSVGTVNHYLQQCCLCPMGKESAVLLHPG